MARTQRAAGEAESTHTRRREHLSTEMHHAHAQARPLEPTRRSEVGIQNSEFVLDSDRSVEKSGVKHAWGMYRFIFCPSCQPRKPF